MAETKEGTPLPNSEIPPMLQRPTERQSLIPIDLSVHPLDAYLQRSPAELKAEAERLQKAAETFKNHWTFVFLGIGLTLFGYYRNIQTTRTLSEIRDYVRSRK